jgi:hypothetical protein
MDDIDLILYTVESKFRKNKKQFSGTEIDIKWSFLIRRAMNNRILYVFVKSIINNGMSIEKNEKALEICKKGDHWLNKFNKTLRIVEKYFGHSNYSVIKTFKYFQDITFDIDIIVLDKNSDILFKTIEHLCLNEKFILSKIKGGYELKPSNEDEYLVIDIYTDFLHGKNTIISTDFVFNKSNDYKYLNKKYLTPSFEAELLLYISQINFQNRFITLHDFLQVIGLICTGLDWDKLLEEVSDNNWKDSFIETISIIHGLYAINYGTKLNIPIKANLKIKNTFPYFLGFFSSMKYDHELCGNYKNISQNLRYSYYKFLSYNLRHRLPIYRDWMDIDLVKE